MQGKAIQYSYSLHATEILRLWKAAFWSSHHQAHFITREQISKEMLYWPTAEERHLQKTRTSRNVTLSAPCHLGTALSACFLGWYPSLRAMSCHSSGGWQEPGKGFQMSFQTCYTCTEQESTCHTSVARVWRKLWVSCQSTGRDPVRKELSMAFMKQWIFISVFLLGMWNRNNN